MKIIYWIIIMGLLFIILVFQIDLSYLFITEDYTPKEEHNLKLETIESKEEGKIDNGIFRNKDGVAMKWIRDSNHDGRPDKWSFFKDGRSFLNEEDTNNDGKVDVIYLNINDSQGIKQRAFSFVLKDIEENIFVVHEDTGWKPDDANQTNKKSR